LEKTHYLNTIQGAPVDEKKVTDKTGEVWFDGF